MTSYKRKFTDYTQEQLLQLGYETGKELVELNRLHARLDNDRRKIIHRVM